MINNDFNHIFVPNDLDIEKLNIIGNYHPKELFGIIKVFDAPPYSLLIDKNKVNEINLSQLSDNKLFWIDFGCLLKIT